MVRKNNILIRRHRERLRYIFREVENNIQSPILHTRLKQDTRLPKGDDFLEIVYLDDTRSKDYWRKFIVISENNVDVSEYTVKMEYIDNRKSNKNGISREFVKIEQFDIDTVMDFIDSNLGPINY